MPAALLALLPGWAQGWALKAALFFAALVAVGMVVLRIRESGRQAERVDNLVRAVEAENVRKKVDLAVARASPAERERLRAKVYRD